MSILKDSIVEENTIRSILKEKIKGALSRLSLEKYEDLVQVTVNKHLNFGEYATNIALLIAKKINETPLDIAHKIEYYLEVPDFVEKVKIEKPGFINFYIDYLKFLDQNITPTLKAIQYPKIVIEHTSVNPNKSLHIGHLRNAVLGDTIALLLKKLFDKVEIQNYIDDTGVQVADTVAALVYFKEIKTPEEVDRLEDPFDDLCWDLYARFHQLLKDEALKDTLQDLRQEILHQIEKQEGPYFQISQRVVQRILDHHLSELSQYGISYDLLVYERDVIRFKLWDAAFELLKKTNKIKFFKEGKYANCWVFISKNLPPKILVRSDNTKVYTAKDIAYHLWKVGYLDTDFKYSKWQGKLYKDSNLFQTNPEGEDMPKTFGQAQKVINVIDARQSYPQQVVKTAIEEITNKKDLIYHLAYGVVALSPQTAKMLGISAEGSILHMSGRKGIGVKSKELYNAVYQEIQKKAESSGQDLDNEAIKAITVASIRYHLLSFTTSRDIVFDIKQATQYIGKTGPYLQYSYVRAINILKKADQEVKPLLFSQLTSEERQLLKEIIRYYEVLYDTISNLEPSIMAEYAYQLASAFNAFYEKHPVLHEKDSKLKNFRLYLVKLFLDTFKEVLNILGIPLIEKM